MDLAVRDLGGAGRPPLLILHGLLGSSRNWLSAGRDLAERWHVLALDLRNHGGSPHNPVHTYAALTSDVAHWIDRHLPDPPWLLGHSMGGKVALRLAARHPDRVAATVIVDIAPRPYPDTGTYRAYLDALLAIDLASLPSREAADLALREAVPDEPMRRFLLTNLERARSPDPSSPPWRWIANLPTLRAALPGIYAHALEPAEIIPGPLAFIFGEHGYYRPGDEAAIARHHAGAPLLRIAGAGHNPHFDQREAFASSMLGLASESGQPLFA